MKGRRQNSKQLHRTTKHSRDSDNGQFNWKTFRKMAINVSKAFILKGKIRLHPVNLKIIGQYPVLGKEVFFYACEL